MFPNDDICNVETAKLAAMRLFKKYRRIGNNQKSGLGKDQVNNLMRATYEAINMPYNPNEQDIFSFMSVFDSNNDGNIELRDIEQIAVKYLCGTQNLSKLSNPEQKSIQKQSARQKSQIQQESISIGGKHQPYKKNKIYNDNKLSIEINAPVIEPPKYKTIYSPGYKPQQIQQSINTFYSPKHINYQSSLKLQNIPTNQKLQVETVIRSGQSIFNKYANPQSKGILETEAGSVISQTYAIFHKNAYNPNGEDINVWMKLCAKAKSNVVDWQGYKHFLIKTYERQIQNKN